MEQWALEYQLVNASPEFVFEWLKEKTEEEQYGVDREGLEKLLLARNDKLINLGLALFCKTPDVGYKLFSGARTTVVVTSNETSEQPQDSAIKKAALSGRSVKDSYSAGWLINEDVLPKLLSGWDEELLRVLLSNPSIPDEILIDIFERNGVFKDLSKDKWVLLVGWVGSNERLAVPYSSTWMDGYGEYLYEKVFTSAWQLFEVFPLNKAAARVLEFLSEKLVVCVPSGMDVMDVVKRWGSPDNSEDEEAFAGVREALIKLVETHSGEFKKLKDSDDLAVRKGYYGNMKRIKPQDVKACFEKDGSNFLDAALYNKSFFSCEEVREALKEACWSVPDKNSMMDYPNYFNVHREALESKHPEWFQDNVDGSLPFEKIEDPHERLEKRVEYLSKQVNDIHRSLLVPDDNGYEEEEVQKNNALEGIQKDLQTITIYIKGIDKSLLWLGLGVVGILVFELL